MEFFAIDDLMQCCIVLGAGAAVCRRGGAVLGEGPAGLCGGYVGGGGDQRERPERHEQAVNCLDGSLCVSVSVSVSLSVSLSVSISVCLSVSLSPSLSL